MFARSKFTHLFGKPFKRDFCYDNVRATDSAWDANFIAANPKYFGVVWKVGGGGAFAVIPHEKVGRLPVEQPLYAGHTAPVLDIAFNPFHDQLIASGSEDCTIKIWSIPEDGLTDNVTEPLTTLSAHSKKVGTLLFHPSASNVLLSGATDPAIKIWDIEQGRDMTTIAGHFGTDVIQGIAWNYDGSQIATTNKKKLRLFDPRTGELVTEVDAHQGFKSSKIVYLHGKNRLLSTGFSRTTDREMMVWDERKMNAPVHVENIDNGTGIFVPFYDADTGVIFLAGKGDTNIRLYDTDKERPTALQTFTDTEPQRGMCMMPKRVLDVGGCEVARLLKLTRSGYVIPIRFEVPRRDPSFQSDLFPDTASGEPAITAQEWFGGANAAPLKVSVDPSQGAVKTFQPYSFNPLAPSPTAGKPASSPQPTAPVPSPTPMSAKPTSAPVARPEAHHAELEAANARIAQLEKENRMLKDSILSLQAQVDRLSGTQAGLPQVPHVPPPVDEDTTTEEKEWE